MYIESSVQEKVFTLFQKKTKTIHDVLGIAFTYLSKDKVCATMPVDDRTQQPFGLLHGGASVVLAESCASIGAWLVVDETQYQAMGIEINANHLRPVLNGTVTATATPIHIGKTTHVWGIEIADDAGRPTCIARCTIAIRGIFNNS